MELGGVGGGDINRNEKKNEDPEVKKKANQNREGLKRLSSKGVSAKFGEKDYS